MIKWPLNKFNLIRNTLHFNQLEKQDDHIPRLCDGRCSRNTTKRMETTIVVLNRINISTLLKKWFYQPSNPSFHMCLHFLAGSSQGSPMQLGQLPQWFFLKNHLSESVFSRAISIMMMNQPVCISICQGGLPQLIHLNYSLVHRKAGPQE